MVWNQLLQKKQWHKFFSQPHPSIPPFGDKLKAQKCQLIADIGCGLGRHIAWLQNAGFDVYGCDTSIVGVGLARKSLNNQFAEDRIQVADMTNLPWPESFFDAVICVNVLYHGTLETGKRCIAELRRVAKPGAPVLFTLLSDSDPEFGNGAQIESNTFIFETGYERGVIHHFYDKKTTQEIAAIFENSNYYQGTFQRAPGGETGEYWVVEGKAPVNKKKD